MMVTAATSSDTESAIQDDLPSTDLNSFQEENDETDRVYLLYLPGGATQTPQFITGPNSTDLNATETIWEFF